MAHQPLITLILEHTPAASHSMQLLVTWSQSHSFRHLFPSRRDLSRLVTVLHTNRCSLESICLAARLAFVISVIAVELPAQRHQLTLELIIVF